MTITFSIRLRSCGAATRCGINVSTTIKSGSSDVEIVTSFALTNKSL